VPGCILTRWLVFIVERKDAFHERSKENGTRIGE
jgi:hypothetical protein